MEKIIAGELFEYLKKRDPDLEIYGQKEMEIVGFSSLDHYKTGSITWLKNQSAVDLSKRKFTAIVCPPDVEVKADVKIVAGNPRDIFFTAIEIFDDSEIISGIASTAILGKNVQIGENVFIGEYCVIGDNVQIGNETIIEAHVVLNKNVKIGKRCLIKSGAVIGGRGYGYSKRDHIYYRIKHFGGVSIGNDVDIGSNTCIDRGTIDDTIIGNGVKIDNLCHIAHNVVIKDNSCIVASSIICGSASIGKEVYIAPGSSVMNQIEVEDGAMIGMGAGVINNIFPNTVNIGFPTRTIRMREEKDWMY